MPRCSGRRGPSTAAAEWRRNDDAGHYLWEAERLGAALAALGLPPASPEEEHAVSAALATVSDLDEDGRRFLRACAGRAQAVRRRERRRRTRTVSVLSALLVLTVVLAVLAGLLAVRQQQRAATAEQKAAAVQLATGADAVRDGNPRLALQLGIAAHKLSPDQDTAASAAAGILETLTTPHPLGEPLIGHTDYVLSVAFSPDGRTLASGSADRTVRLWDLADPARPRLFRNPLAGHTKDVWSVAFSPDGRTLASGGADDTVRLWDVADPGRPRLLGDPLVGHTVRSVAFSPDGRTLASGGDVDTVRLWDVADPARLRLLGESFPGHNSDVSSVAFSPDGRTLATESYDDTVRLWDVAAFADLRANLVEHACEQAGTGLDEQTWEIYARGVPYRQTCPP